VKLYVKILLAFTVVIAIAVFAIAIAVSQIVGNEFRSYNALYSNRAQRTAQDLISYYAAAYSWNGLQEHIGEFTPGGRGFGQGPNNDFSASGGSWSFRVADTDAQIVANLSGDVEGSLSRGEIRNALPLEYDGVLIGYMALSDETPLDQPGEEFIYNMQSALWFGIAIAFVAAMFTAGLLVRGFTAPIRTLTQAAEAISDGALDSRALVSGRDEIAQLAETFNQMAASLQQVEASRQVQTADIAHELRNPLAVLQGSLEALADGVYKPTPENIEPALDQVRTLNRLVEDLRILALVDAGGLQLDLQPLDLAQFLQRVADAHRENFDDADIQFHYTTPTTALPVEADYARLTQVIDNILGNALRYVPSAGTVCLEAKLIDRGVVVSVIDDGPGVNPSDLTHLFERFWRGDPSRSRETGGSGLGLTIARKIIEAHHGRIWGEATPGGGLTLRFWLPKA
jgi:two-component system sensor histidine kinase BaeS